MPAIRTTTSPYFASNIGSSIHYPKTKHERASYKTNDGKRVTSHQWAVYDFLMTVPKGRVTTYKEIANSIGGSPRSVGGALRSNPFAPHVPCHRIIASSLFIGGFLGEWGKESKTGTQCLRKLKLLEEEGVHFTEQGYLKDPKDALWKPADTSQAEEID